MRANTLRKKVNWRGAHNTIKFYYSEHIKTIVITKYYESPPGENTKFQEHLTHDCRAVARTQGKSIRKFCY